jgi:tRNA-binding EMAP/Myf-like protein
MADAVLTRFRPVEQPSPAALKPIVSVADLEKLDIRVGTIVPVGDVPQSQKLVRLRVDFGDHTRTILAGMKAESYFAASAGFGFAFA